jgi:regulator of replication initiation timing
MGYSGVPYWVSKQNEALIEDSHRALECQYLDKIRELEKVNGELKKENLELKRENADLKQRLKDFDPIQNTEKTVMGSQ